MASDGALCLILHAHLPFVRHPEYPEFLEEDWLYEAITETYLPLLEVFEGLWNDGIDFRISMTMSPPLVAMLNDPMLRERYVLRMQQLLQLCDDELGRREGEALALAGYYKELFTRRLQQFEQRYTRDLVAGFRLFQDRGRLEVLTCGATHGFLPLMQHQPEAVRAQVRVAVEQHTQNFGRAPNGIWLPECGYFPGLDKVLREEGLTWFVGESHSIEHASPRPSYGVHAPLYTPSGVAVFARDREVSAQVWSSESGYPGHVAYREFYRDLGYDAPFEQVAAYVQPTGARKMTGLKYHRITGKDGEKSFYNPQKAREIAADHAGNFAFNRQAQLKHLRGEMGREAVVVAPYDAELFGHWWYEGPLFIDFLLRKVACDIDSYRLATPSEVLRDMPEQEVAQPNFSTWGANGYAEVWLDSSNEWVYPHLNEAAARMVELAQAHPRADGLTLRALNQAARELLLAQSSDWAFIMQTATSVEYAVKRTKDHLLRFNALYDQLQAGEVDPELLVAIELRDTLFPDLDYRVYRTAVPAQDSQ